MIVKVAEWRATDVQLATALLNIALASGDEDDVDQAAGRLWAALDGVEAAANAAILARVREQEEAA
jgi:hypothetical protein